VPFPNVTDLAPRQRLLFGLQVESRQTSRMKMAWPIWFRQDQGTLTLAAQFVGLIQIARRAACPPAGGGFRADLSFATKDA